MSDKYETRVGVYSTVLLGPEHGFTYELYIPHETLIAYYIENIRGHGIWPRKFFRLANKIVNTSEPAWLYAMKKAEYQLMFDKLID